MLWLFIAQHHHVFGQTYSHTVYVKATKQSAIWLFLTRRRNWQNWWRHFLHFLLDADVTTPKKKWCPCEEVPLSHCQRLWSSNRRFSVGPAWLKTSKTSNHVTWDEFVDEKTLLWYCYGFLEQLSLTPSWCQTFRVTQSYIIGKIQTWPLRKFHCKHTISLDFICWVFTIFTCSWHSSPHLCLSCVAYSEEELLKHWQRTNHPKRI